LQGGYQRLFEAPRAYESVTADDIRKLAADLLRQGNRTVGVLTAASPANAQGEGR
jgi:predicted Zn-dependent peptidase